MAETEKIRKGDRLSLYVDKLLHGGSGLCHHGSRACFVDYVIPGETVTAAAAKIKSHYIQASLLSVDEPSAHRIPPACPSFYQCGGCQWQHMTYDRQLAGKSTVLRDCLLRIGDIKTDESLDIIPSPKQFNYRLRAAVKIHHGRVPALGYYQAKTHVIVPVSSCALLSEEINRALAAVNRELQSGTPELRDVEEIQLMSASPAAPVILSGIGPQVTIEASYNPANDSIEPIRRPLYEQVLGLSFQRRPGVFSQVNPSQNVRMIECVLSLLSRYSPKSVIDLYCGSGNFSLFIAHQGAAVTGIDINALSIKQARRNAEINRTGGCRFIKTNSGDFSGHLNRCRGDAFLLNPPRQGCTGATLSAIISHRPQAIVYVSCSPPTLARDLKRLVSAGYRIRSLQPLDMFPQTHHVETVALLDCS